MHINHTYVFIYLENILVAQNVHDEKLTCRALEYNANIYKLI